jgi:hypothetical protein
VEPIILNKLQNISFNLNTTMYYLGGKLDSHTLLLLRKITSNSWRVLLPFDITTEYITFEPYTPYGWRSFLQKKN